MSFLKTQNQNPEFLNNYLKYIRFITLSAETTVNETYFDLRTFFRFVKIITANKNLIYKMDVSKFKQVTIKDVLIDDIAKITQNDIVDFIYFLRYTLENSAKTRNRKLTSIKKFFEYLETNNLINYNPSKFVESSKLEKRQPKYLNLSESKTLLSKMINSNQQFKIRNYTITCIFLNCCIRLSELIQINLTDLKLDEKTIKIRGKGNRERIIYLNDAAYEAIVIYLEVRPNLPKINPDYNALFVSERNKRISRRSVQNIISQMQLNTNDKIHVHTLRHTGATLLYNDSNVNVFIIKKVLGHKSIVATEVYTHISNSKMKEIMETCTISSILEREEFNNGK